jgi:hypothetical protein
MGRTIGMSAIPLNGGKLLAARCQGVDPVLSFHPDGTPKSAVGCASLILASDFLGLRMG